MFNILRKNISLILAIMLLIDFLPNMTGETVYAGEVCEADTIIEDIESEVSRTEFSMEDGGVEENKDVLIVEKENNDIIGEDILSESTQDDGEQFTDISSENIQNIGGHEETQNEEFSNEKLIHEDPQYENIENEVSENEVLSENNILNQYETEADEKSEECTVTYGELSEEDVYENEDLETGKTLTDEQEVIYYETNLKVKALPIAKNVYTGQRNIQIATPVFSNETSNKTIIFLNDNKGQINTNDYDDILGNAYDSESGKLVINIPKYTTPGKHVLTFTAVAPKGCSASQAKLTINIKIGIESLSMTIPSYVYYLNNKDINIKPVTYYYNTTHRPMYDSYIKPTTRKAVYSLSSNNGELLKYITVNSSNGKIKISKKLTREIFDSIKSDGDKFRIVAIANDFVGEDDPGEDYIGKDRSVEREITLTTEGLSNNIKQANEIRGFICHDRNERDEDKEFREIAVIDKNNKTKTSFTIKDAQRLELRLYESADAEDGEYIKNGVIWKVKGPVKSYRSSDRLWLDIVKPGTVTVTAIAADGSGKGSASRVIEIKRDTCKIGLFDDRFGQKVVSANYLNDESYAFQDLEFMILALNDDETETIIDEKYNDHRMDMEHNYKVKISGGVITRCKDGLLDYMPTEPDTKITLINYNKGSDGKRVQPDKVYTIHNECFDRIDSDFDKVKIPTTKVVANKYVPGKKPATIRFEVKNLPDKVVDLGGGHTGYYLTLGNSYKAKTKDTNPDFDDMIAEVPCRAEIMIENGKYYATLTQNIGEFYENQTPCDFVAGTYKLVATITQGDDYDNGDYYCTLNKKLIETTLIITKNNLKTVWEGKNSTNVKVDINEEEPVNLVNGDRQQDTGSFKWGKNKYVESIKITDVKFDLDTANIYKAALLDDDKLLKVMTTLDGDSCVMYTAENFDAVREAVINAASGKTAKKKSSAQTAAAKMIGAKPDKYGNYDIEKVKEKVKPVIKGYFTYTVEGTDEVGYHVITNLTRKFEITLLNE